MDQLQPAWRAPSSLATTFSLFFLLFSFLCVAPMQTANALSNMGNAPPKVDQRPFIHSGHHGMKSHQSAEAADAAASSVIPGVCYSPFHNSEYPLGSNHPGNVQMLGDAMYKDFAVIKDYFRVARTYYTSYYGVPVTPAAAANGVKLYLGVYMTDEPWYNNQVDDAVNAVKSNPDTILAILVGNENIQPAGPYTAKQISDRITAIRARVLGETGRNVLVGTVQRAVEWLESGDRAAIAELAKSCDIIGVNIYPFFDGNYNPQYPLAILDGIWNKMINMYPVAKLRLTEVGFPTGGAPPSYAPNNIPSLANAKAFYNAFRAWSPSQGGGEAFWFMMFDRSPDDTSMGIELETYFGFFTWKRSMKDPSNGFPVVITSTAGAYAPSPTAQLLPTVVVPAGVIPTKITRGVCYSPFHNPEYPLGNNHPGNLLKLGDAINRDFATMRGYFSVVRTYYTSYYGIPVTPIAAANGVKLYLGVYMTDEPWYNNQVDDAVNAVKSNPDTILAILVGNENLQPAGPYTAKQISDRITAIRARVLGETGRNVLVGTAQRSTEWLETGDRVAIAALAASCDIIGVNIYPFFDGKFNPQYPLAIVNGIWDKMINMYPVGKLRLTETGYPTAGAPSALAPNNIPSLANSVAFYNAFVNWTPSRGGGEAFWFMMFDRAAEDSTVKLELERYFGFYNAQGVSKAAGYPLLVTAQTQPAQSPPTSSVVTTTTTTPSPAPTTKAPTTPATGSSTITIPSIAAANVCRVKKLYIP